MLTLRYAQFGELLTIRDYIVAAFNTECSESVTAGEIDIRSTLSVIDAMDSDDHVICYARLGIDIIGFCMASSTAGEIRILARGVLSSQYPNALENELVGACKRWFETPHLRDTTLGSLLP